MRYTVKPHNVCPTSISFDLEGNVVKNIEFVRGCNGNLKAISKLVNGMTVEQIESVLRGNTCGNRDTSCADQLARAVRQCYDESQK
ncbi:MAG TPA: TIGR03905 family TSCPD domain-containing protein [Candidatus Ventrimonas merdavium]|nr:TIGR03905 family TSCPD domain-containing protein [Candidatus Ventrimonas merdavium]